MIREEKQEIYTSFAQAVISTAELVKDGWELDKDLYPVLAGFRYEVNYVRYVEGEVEGRPRTRAEILADARAAKEAKRKAQGDGNG